VKALAACLLGEGLASMVDGRSEAEPLLAGWKTSIRRVYGEVQKYRK
jgi:hypothetical protein